MASYTIGPKIGLDGEKEFRNSLNNINQGLRTLESELKMTASKFADNAKSEEALVAKNDVLNRSIDLQEKKIEEVKKALEFSKKEYGENADSTLKWQRVLNNSETDLNNLRNELSKNEKAIDDVGDSFDEMSEDVKDANENLEKTTKISPGVIAAGTLIADGIKAAGKAIVDLGKQAIDNYSNYEQQVGGIKTLFGAGEQSIEEYAKSVGKSVDDARSEYAKLIEAENAVFENANDAYKTAGITANEYMEVSTSFAASLLQSVGSNTKKAAEIADMAIIDMSDNANKMGSSFEDIENAYKGFAKQNYTMLDNLKLGYGGTKSEMERLLADAERISGIKYNLNNLDDVYNAIHVIQGELGITGTTAKEASETIAGSASSMKAAWENLSVGLVDDEANIEQLMDNFADSVLTFIQNILPRITTGLEQLPQIIVGLVEKIVPVGMEILLALVDGILNALPELLQAALNIIVYLAQALIEYIPKLIPTIVDIVLEIVDILTAPDTLVNLIMAAVELILALVEGLVDAMPKLMDAVPTIISNLVAALIKLLPELIPVAIKIMSLMAQQMINHIGLLLTAAPKVIAALFNGFSKVGKSAKEWGKDFIQNIIDGILSMINKVVNAVKKVANTISSFLHFSVPDRGPLVDVPKWMPDMIDELTKGMYANEGKLKKAANSLAGNITLGFGDNSNVVETGNYNSEIVLNNYTTLDGRIVANNTQKYITQQQHAYSMARGNV